MKRSEANLRSKKERGEFEIEISAMKGMFRGALTSGRIEEARRIVGWFQGVADAAAAIKSPAFYVKRLRNIARILERQIPEYPRRRPDMPPGAFLNPYRKNKVPKICDICNVPLIDMRCPVCNVWHGGDPCPTCGRRGYHHQWCDDPGDPWRESGPASKRTNPLKRFLVQVYTYPRKPGIGTFRVVGYYSTLRSARMVARKMAKRTGVEVQIIDTQTGSIVNRYLTGRKTPILKWN